MPPPAFGRRAFLTGAAALAATPALAQQSGHAHHGGLYEGSVTMVSGISGTGKTVLSVQFLTAAVKAGHKTLLVSLDEHPRQLMRNAGSLGFDLEGLTEHGDLFIHYESPLELELDENPIDVVFAPDGSETALVVAPAGAPGIPATAMTTADAAAVTRLYVRRRIGPPRHGQPAAVVGSEGPP